MQSSDMLNAERIEASYAKQFQCVVYITRTVPDRPMSNFPGGSGRGGAHKVDTND